MKLESTKHSNLKRHPRSKIYYFKRGRVECSLGTKDESQALVRLSMKNAEFDHAGEVAFLHTVAELYREYHDYKTKQKNGELDKERKIREGTYLEIGYLFSKHLLPYFGEMKVAEITSARWFQYTRHTRARSLTNHRKVLQGFLKWCRDFGYLAGVPDITKLPHHVRRKRRIVTNDELLAIFRNANGSLKLFLALALYNGLRRKEIMTLKWAHVHIDQRYLVIKPDDNKLDRGRSVPINDTLAALFLARLRLRNPRTPWVFPHRHDLAKHAYVSGLRTAWHTCLRRAGLEGITWHDFRATSEVWTNKSTAHTDTQREKFSDASIEVQKRIYAHMSHEDLRGLENAVQVPGLDALLTEKAGVNL